MEEWKEYKLGEITNMKNGKKRPHNNGVFPVYGGNGIMDYSDTYNAENAIIVGRVGAYCGCVYKCDGKCWVSDNAISVSAKEIVDTHFLYYLMTSLDFHHHHIGGAQPLMTQDIIGDFTVSIPPMPVQHQIVQILKFLDDKIEVNRRINDNFYYAFFEIMLIWLVISLENDNLEKQAQALFKSWFVDYEPFHNLPFIDSEQGRIPEGWCATVLEDLCSFISRGLTPKYDESSNELILGQTCVRNNIVTIDNARKHSPKQRTDKWVKRWDTLINSTGVGSLGRVGIVYFDMDNVAIDSHITVVRPKSALVRHYVGRNLLNRQLEIENMAIGSTGQTELPKDRVKSLPIILPDDNTLTRFNAIIEPIACLLYRNVEESRHITTLRDSLLPRLMSGELKINDLMM